MTRSFRRLFVWLSDNRKSQRTNLQGNKVTINHFFQLRFTLVSELVSDTTHGLLAMTSIVIYCVCLIILNRSFLFVFSNNRWALCPSGYYLNGVRISGQDYIHLIEEARCCRPLNHPNGYEDCYDEDAGNSFAQKGWSNCQQAGYYMAGFYRGNCDKFDCLEKLRCCKMKNGNFILLYLIKKWTN